MTPTSSTAIGITGPENLLLLFADWRDGGALDLLAAALSRIGRPAAAVILAEAPGDAPHRLDDRLRALAGLGVPDDRLLFVGFAAGGIPRPGERLFGALIEALRLLSWRRDCSVLGVQAADPSDPAGLAMLAVAQALARREGLPLLVAGVAPGDRQEGRTFSLAMPGDGGGPARFLRIEADRSRESPPR